jgi:ABC-type glutathione transport system ATPase component
MSSSQDVTDAVADVELVPLATTSEEASVDHELANLHVGVASTSSSSSNVGPLAHRWDARGRSLDGEGNAINIGEVEISLPGAGTSGGTGKGKGKTEEDYVVTLNNIHKTYLLGVEGVPALRGVTVDIKRGEFVILLGKSGGGKTSLMNIIGTIDKPTKGELQVCGTRITSNTTDEELASIRLSRIGFVFQVCVCVCVCMCVCVCVCVWATVLFVIENIFVCVCVYMHVCICMLTSMCV